MRANPGRFSSLVPKIAIGLVSLVVSILLLEGSLRIANPPHDLKEGKHPLFLSMREPDQEIYWTRETYEPVLVRINSRGFRDEERSILKPRGTIRVLMLGDSFVEALATPFEQIAAVQLEALLQSEIVGARVEVVNVGKSGWSTASELQFLRHEAPNWGFDIVVLNFFEGNDFADNQRQRERTPPYFTIDGEDVEFPPFEVSRDSVLARLLQRSALVDALRTRVGPDTGWKRGLRRWLTDIELAPALVELGLMEDQRKGAPDPMNPERALETSVVLIAAANRAARSQGARLVVNMIPDPGAIAWHYPDEARVPVGGKRSPGAYWSASSGPLLRALEQRDIPTIRDWNRLTRDAREGRVLYRGYAGHWTAEGNRRAAEDISREILPFMVQRAEISR